MEDVSGAYWDTLKFFGRDVFPPRHHQQSDFLNEEEGPPCNSKGREVSKQSCVVRVRGWGEKSFVVCVLWKYVLKWTEMQHGETQNRMWSLVSALQWQDLNRAFVQYLAHCSQGSNGPLGETYDTLRETGLGRNRRTSPCRRNSDGVFCHPARLFPAYQDASPKQRSFAKERAAPGWCWLWADSFMRKVVVRNWLLLNVRWLRWFDFL